MPRWVQVGLWILAAVVVWQLVRGGLVDQERQVRTRLKEAAEQAFPTEAAAARERYGLMRLHEAQEGRAEIVLIHGLDDPGKVWMNLAPALHADGYGVSVMTYPNDQPVRESAALFRESLRAASNDGLGRISIVAHSMGGLVSREMLSNPTFACDRPDCRIPNVQRLIMIGTPNHGSSLARFRGLGELREQVARVLAGQAGWLDWIFDGAGEAGIDITPGSPFLMTLNARPNPRGTDLCVIAGVIAQEQAEAMQRLIAESVSGEAGLQLVPLAQRLGDGLVSLESATLEGVPLYRVEGTHLSIVRNLDAASERVPPAIPIVLDLLAEGHPANN